MEGAILHTPYTISSIDATVDEESSYYLHTEYEGNFPFNVKYDNSKYTIEQLLDIINTFCVFHAKVKISKDSNQSVSSSIPIEVFRYKLLDDGSWYSVNTAPSRHKDGSIVEGALWSNGLFYIKTYQNKISEAVLYIDLHTKDFYRYP